MKAAIAWVCILGAATIACLGGSSAPTATPEPTLTPTATATSVPTATATLAPSPTATSTPATIDLQNTVSTVFYDVFGSTGADIFASMEANGPRDDAGEDALGLASWVWTVPSISTRMAQGGCEIQSFSMTVPLVVTLPRHGNAGGLTPDIAQRWTILAAEVAAHEQTHVDIVVEGMRDLEQKLEALGSRASCSLLRADINELWAEESDLIDAGQDAFHVADEARLDALRFPLEMQVDANQAQLLALEASIASFDSQLAVTEAEIGQIEATYPDLVLPSDVYDSYQALIASFNATVAERNSLVDEHDALVFTTNRIIEDINWLQ